MESASVLPAIGLPARPRLRLTPMRIAIVMTLIALGVRLIGLGQRPLWLDEAYSAWFASRDWQYLWTVVPTYEPHPPFYYSLLKLWRGLFGGGAIALRASSMLLSALTVPVAIAAAIELERQSPTGRPLLRSGMTALLVALSPTLVMFGQEPRPYPLLVLAFAVALLALLHLMRQLNDGGAGAWRWWLTLAAATEVGLWAHGLGALYTLCLAVALASALLRRPFSGQGFARGATAAVLVSLLYVPCLAMMAKRAGDWGGSGWLSWDPSMLLQLVALYTVPIEVLGIVTAAAALAILLLTKRALQNGVAGRGWTADRAILLLWLGPPLLAALISQLFIPVFLPRTLAPTIVAAALALGGALARIDGRRERLALGAVLAIGLGTGAVQIALRPPVEDWAQVRAFLEAQAGPGDQVWLYPNDSALPLGEAGARLPMRGIPGDYPSPHIKGPIRAGSPAVVSLTPRQAAAIAHDPSIRNVPTIWLVTRQSGLFDPANDLPQALGTVRTSGRQQQWGYISVRPYTRR